MHRSFAVALTIGAIVWSAALFLAPFAAASGHAATSAAASVLYMGASRVCHQRAERSFHLAGLQMPVCARCTGLYVSGAAGALLAFLIHGRPRVPGRARDMLIAAAIPTAATVALEFAGLAHPSNTVRAVSAVPLGALAGWVFIRSLCAEGRIPQSSHSAL